VNRTFPCPYCCPCHFHISAPLMSQTDQQLLDNLYIYRSLSCPRLQIIEQHYMPMQVWPSLYVSSC
jgi:hypothetical protein